MMKMESVPHGELLQLKKPTILPNGRAKMVLDEETYIEKIGKIIQRDFFPDLETLKAQNAYLEAVETKDVKKLIEICGKYNGTGQVPPPPTDLLSPVKVKEQIEPGNGLPKKKRLSLDQYLNTHTSQDNESFEEIINESARKHAQRYSYFYHDEETEELQKKLLDLPSIDDQALPMKKELNVGTWGYKNRNYIMFNPEGVKLTREEQIEKIKKRQEVVYENTRLIVNPYHEAKRKENITEVANIQAKVLNGKIGVDGKEILTQGLFSFVPSPSATPGVLGTPLLTWGEIEGTPFRLDGSDTPLPRKPGPSFKMSEPPRREQLAMALAEQAGEKNRDRKRRDINAQKLEFSSTTPRPIPSAMDRLAVMSPAAKRLVSSSFKLSLESNSSGNTPLIGSPKGPATPLVRESFMRCQLMICCGLICREDAGHRISFSYELSSKR